MKTKTILCAALLAFISCNKMEQPTYHEQLFRVATVQTRLSKAWLAFDGYTDQPVIKNFRDTLDMARYNVKDGDRVMVSVSFDAVGDMNNSTFTLDELMVLDPLQFADTIPSDTLNSYYQFTEYCFVNFVYPDIWAAGHFVNVAPGFSIPSIDDKATFSIYPTGVKRDTLIMCVYSDIPTARFGMNTEALLTCDISSLRKPAAGAQEQARRDSLLNILDRLGKDSIMVKVTMPDTLRALSSQSPGKYIKIVDSNALSVKIPFDF